MADKQNNHEPKKYDFEDAVTALRKKDVNQKIKDNAAKEIEKISTD
ncbi:MAG: hypothetical protein ACK4OM_03775 [Alphaproteobacteria bacterium]